MENKLSSLNNFLFAQLERLDEEELSGEKLQDEIARAKAITDVAQQVIANGSLVLKAHMVAAGVTNKGECNIIVDVPKMLTE